MKCKNNFHLLYSCDSRAVDKKCTGIFANRITKCDSYCAQTKLFYFSLYFQEGDQLKSLVNSEKFWFWASAVLFISWIFSSPEASNTYAWLFLRYNVYGTIWSLFLHFSCPFLRFEIQSAPLSCLSLHMPRLQCFLAGWDSSRFRASEIPFQ